MNEKQYPIRMPDDLRREIKILCARKGITMKEFFDSAIRTHLKALDTAPDQK